MTVESAPRRRRFVGIEGLRGLAAFSVLAHHVFLHTTNRDGLGRLDQVSTLLGHGLTLFFALSGLLLYLPFAAAIADGRTLPSIRRYGQNRFLRIYPAYLVIFAAVAFIFGAAYLDGAPSQARGDVSGYMSDPLDIVASLLLVQTYFPGSLGVGIGPAWSLTAEIAFYILMPLLAVLAFKASRRIGGTFAVLAPALLLIAVGWGTKLWAQASIAGMQGSEIDSFGWGHTWTAVVQRSVLAQADLFGYGMLAATLIVLVDRRLRMSAATSTGLLVLAAAAMLVALKLPWAEFRSSAAGIGASLVILFVVLLRRDAETPAPLARLLATPVPEFLGRISYSVYLWHVPVIWWLMDHDILSRTNSLGGYLVHLAVVVAITIALSWITYKFVERRALDMKRPATRAASSSSHRSAP